MATTRMVIQREKTHDENREEREREKSRKTAVGGFKFLSSSKAPPRLLLLRRRHQRRRPSLCTSTGRPTKKI